MTNKLCLVTGFVLSGVFLSAGCDRQQTSAGAGTNSAVVATTTPQTPRISPSVAAGRQSVTPVPLPPAGIATQAPTIELGDLEQRPILFFELRPGMLIRIANIKYDKLGWVESYEASVGDDVKLMVRTQTGAVGGKAPTYFATSNGRPVSKQTDKKLVGFAVKDATGVVLPGGSGNVKTKLDFDAMGRQQAAQQDFGHAGKSYSIAFADYHWDMLGHLEGYTARVVKAE